MIIPVFRFNISGRTLFMQKNNPLRLVSMTSSHWKEQDRFAKVVYDRAPGSNTVGWEDGKSS